MIRWPLAVLIVVLIGVSSLWLWLGQSPPINKVEFSEVRTIVDKHCLPCHSKHPTDPTWLQPDPPEGLSFDDDQTILDFADAIGEQVAVTRLMPQGNRTRMTDAERERIKMWAEALRPMPQ